MFRFALSRALAPSRGYGGSALRWAAVRSLSSALPDHKLITMPALSPTMEVGTIQEWKKKQGDSIEGGDVLAEIETDKATRSYEYNDDGFIAKVFIEEGASDVPVGEPLAIIVEEEEDIAAFKDYVPTKSSDAAAEAETPAAEAPASTPEPSSTPPSPSPNTPTPTPTPVTSAPGARVIASPLARMVAQSAGVELANVSATGPGGRVIAADVAEALASGVASAAVPSATVMPAGSVAAMSAVGMPEYTDAEATKFQRISAERLLESKTTIPHYYLTVDCTVDSMLAMRAALNGKARDGEYKLSVNDFVIKAAATALRRVPEVNSQWMGDRIRTFHSADISIAVMTPAGLITPIVKDADRKGLKEISADVKSLAAKAKDNALAPEEFMGGTFTISNLGMYGVSNFSAIINPPQAAILAVGASERKVVLDDTSESGFSTKTVLTVTMSCDHRVVDGAIGAKWLQEFKACMEEPVNIIM